MGKEKAREQFELVLGDATTTQPINRVPKKKSNNALWYYLGLSNQIGLSISLPLALGAICGGFVDLRMNSRPTFVLTGLTIGFVISIINFYNLVRKIVKHSNKK